MEWTTTKPTVPGWYWYRNGKVKAFITEAKYEDGELCADWGTSIATTQGEWAGPIEEPTERGGA